MVGWLGEGGGTIGSARRWLCRALPGERRRILIERSWLKLCLHLNLGVGVSTPATHPVHPECPCTWPRVGPGHLCLSQPPRRVYHAAKGRSSDRQEAVLRLFQAIRTLPLGRAGLFPDPRAVENGRGCMNLTQRRYTPFVPLGERFQPGDSRWRGTVTPRPLGRERSDPTGCGPALHGGGGRTASHHRTRRCR